MLPWLWISAVIIVLDQFTKQLAESYLHAYQAQVVCAYFDLTLMYNSGAAFSFLSDQGGWQRWFLIAVAFLVTVFMVVWLAVLKRCDRRTAIALSLIVGGAVGNLIDRMLYGHVIDFIHVHYEQWYWPAFNIADSAITLGVIVMLIDAFFPQQRADA